MFKRFVRFTMKCRNPGKKFSTSPQKKFKVCVIGSSGGIGQPLCLLLKQELMITCLNTYDISKVNPGVKADLSHINTAPYVQAFTGPEELSYALIGCHVVVIPAGLPRKPGMSRDDLFNANASLVYDLACSVACYCPCALVAIITNPVNSMVPIFSEVLMRVIVISAGLTFQPGVHRVGLFKSNASLIQELACSIGTYSPLALVAVIANPTNSKCGCYDPCKIFGVTTLDIVRASTFVGQISSVDPSCIDIPVIGGHAGKTIIPLLSQSRPAMPPVTQEEIQKLTGRIQEAGTEVVKAKAGGGSATLSMAFAAARFVKGLLKGLSGESVIECAYVRSCETNAAYFSNPLVLGRCGIEKNLGVGQLSPYESTQLQEAIPILVKNIEDGIKFVFHKTQPPPTKKPDKPMSSAKSKC